MRLLSDRSKGRAITGAWIGAVLVLALAAFAIQRKPAAATVLSAPLAKGDILESVYGIGIVQAQKIYAAKADGSGTVKSLPVREGDRVRAGQVLATLDHRTLAAPFAGILTSLPVSPGEKIQAGSPLFTLTDLDGRFLVAALEQRAALRVRPGQEVKLNFDGLRDRTFDGTVEAVYSKGGDFLVRIGVAGLPQELLPGMTADVAIAVQTRRDVLLVPVAAIDHGTVRVSRAGAAPQAVPVTLGIVTADTAELASGDLHAGDRLEIRVRSGHD